MQENNKSVGSFDEVLDAIYGAPGTPQREEFRREAYAYCCSDTTTPQIKQSTRRKSQTKTKEITNYIH